LFIILEIFHEKTMSTGFLSIDFGVVQKELSESSSLVESTEGVLQGCIMFIVVSKCELFAGGLEESERSDATVDFVDVIGSLLANIWDGHGA
jgi:hypothetical protein